MNTYFGKEVKLCGKWYNITLKGNSYKEILQRFKKKYVVGHVSPYGPIVEGIRGRFVKQVGF